MYVCGPTVQSNPHVGHGRSAVAFDVIRRYLTYRGFEVTYVKNITDIDDKIIAAALDQEASVEEIAAAAAERFQDTQDLLGVMRPTVEPKATDHIDQIQAMIQDLIDKGHAYESNGDVYFSVRSFAGYARLSNRNVDDMLAGARIAIDETKRDPLDFALWKAAKQGEPEWPSPWGAGRPGWHIECSAMARTYLGDTFDIHGGGTDLIFPHHENEIAQSEAVTGQPFARVWLHNGMVTLSGEKMAKSTGHVVDLATLLAENPPLAVRLFYLRAHYRSNLEFSAELIADASASYERLQSFVRRHGTAESVEPDARVIADFLSAMDDDFNTPVALSVLFDAVREGNRLADSGGDFAPIVAAVLAIMEVLGLDDVNVSDSDLASVVAELIAIGDTLDIDTSGTADDVMSRIVDRREAARANKEWTVSDQIRDRLGVLGIVIEDGSDGASWHRK